MTQIREKEGISLLCFSVLLYFVWDFVSQRWQWLVPGVQIFYIFAMSVGEYKSPALRKRLGYQPTTCTY